MSIKTKLSSILVVIVFFLAGLSLFSFWYSNAIKTEIKRADHSLNYFAFAGKIHEIFSEQMRQLPFLVSTERTVLGKELLIHMQLSREAERAFRSLNDCINGCIKLGQKNKKDLYFVNEAEKKFQKVLQQVSEIIKLESNDAKRQILISNLEAEVDSFQNRISHLLNDEFKALNNSLKNILAKGGLIRSIAKKVERTRLAVLYFKTSQEIKINLNRLLKELSTFALTGRKWEIDEVYELLEQIKSDFLKNIELFNLQEKLGFEGEEKDTLIFKSLNSQFANLLPAIRQLLSTNKPSKNEEFIKIYEKKFLILFNKEFFPKITDAVKDGREEIAVAWTGLLNEINFLLMAINAFLLIFCVFFLLLFWWVIRSIVSSLESLKKGTEKLKDGALDYRIISGADDEFGLLGKALNEMADGLQKARNELLFSRQYLDQIIKSMLDPLIVLSAEGNIQTINSAAKELIHHDVEEITGKKLNDFLTFEENSSDYWFSKLKKKGNIKNEENTITLYNGTKIPLLVSAAKMPDETEMEGNFVLVFRDISQRKKAEKEKAALAAKLRQSQKMEALGTLAGGIAHDFNNILMAITGFTEAIRDEIQANKPAEDYLQEILLAGKRGTELVEQILSFSSSQKKEFQQVDVQIVIKEVLQLISSSLPANITIKQDIKENCPPIFAVTSQVFQIVMNLCTNAYQAMEKKGGTIKLELMDLEINDMHRDFAAVSNTAGHYLLFSVRDSGHGISPDLQKRIFDPYFTTREKTGGTGLGLYTVYGIVKGLGGNIEVKSKTGKGTLFNVFLPVFLERANSMNNNDVILDDATTDV
ncbi:ATP-binding protein [Candidatus Riflebacteria bacterium]